jgi:shikimate kinase
VSDTSRIFLVGPMGSGKSTIGQHLARARHCQFMDSDQEIERRTGVKIALIFDIEGEDGFREREARIIDELTLYEDIVLATGGGAVLRAENRHCLRERGYVVYLKTGVEKLVERTRFDSNRPLLRTADPAATLQHLVATREPLYEEVAHLVVDTGKASVKQVVKRIMSSIA